jgi:predicted nucleic acid-binding protein
MNYTFTTMAEFAEVTNTLDATMRQVSEMWECTNPHKQGLVTQLQQTLLDSESAAIARAVELGLIKSII